MAANKTNESGSLQDTLGSGGPITHFFYEYQGERAVDPLLLIENGITLWHEKIYTDDTYDNSYLWELAADIVQDRESPPHYSWVEWVRFRITTGAFVPGQWDSRKPYPFKGLLISAVYFQEAKRLCEGVPQERVWHILTLAYYHLGLNTGSSTQQNTSRAAQMMHASRTVRIRALVLAALDKVKADASATSMESAKDQVVELLRKNMSKVKHWLDEFDTLVPEKTKGRSQAKVKNDVLVRLRHMLDNWTLPSGPYPEIAEAFAHFSKRKQAAALRSNSERATSEGIPIDDSDFYLRLISFLDDDTVMTLKISKEDAT